MFLVWIGDWVDCFEVVGEVCGKGVMFGVEFVKFGMKDLNFEVLVVVLKYVMMYGVILFDVGLWDLVLCIMLSVVISEVLIDDVVFVFEEVFVVF